MTTETRLATVEAQLQSLTGHMLGLSNAHLQQTERMNGLIDLTAANARAIAELRTATDANTKAIADIYAAIDRLTQAMDARLADLDQKLEQYTDGLMAMLDQGIDTVIARRIAPLETSITGLQLEVQRLIERLNP